MAKAITEQMRIKLVQLYKDPQFKTDFIQNYLRAGLTKNSAESEFFNAFNLLASNPQSQFNLAMTSFDEIKSAFISVSEMGLSFNPKAKECYLSVKYNEHTQRHELDIIIGYLGMTALIMRSGFIHRFSDMIVYSDDNFSFLGGSKEPEIVSTGVHDESAEVVAGVITFYFTDGQILTHLVPKQELLEIESNDFALAEEVTGDKRNSLYASAWREKLLRIATLRSAFKKYRHVLTKQSTNLEPTNQIDSPNKNQFESEFLIPHD